MAASQRSASSTGTLFRRAYSSWASCLPSRSSFLSGWQPTRAEIRDWDAHHPREGLLREAVYLPQHFKAHGYFTGRLDKVFHIGKDDPVSWFLSEEPFRDARGRFKAVWTGAEVASLQLENRVREEGRFPEVAGEKGVYAVLDVEDDGLFDGITAARAVALLGDRSAMPEPFLLTVGFRRPHQPWIAPEAYFDLHPADEVELPPRAAEGKEQPVEEKVHREMIAHYRAATSYVDAQVARVMAALEASGAADNTVVVLFGDHGYCLGERGAHFGKGNLWERSLHTTLIFAGPGIRAGGVVDAPVSLLDLYPTLVDLCGLPRPAVPLDGRTLGKWLREGQVAAWRGDAVSYYLNGTTGGIDASVRTRRFRYTESAAGEARELVNLEDDPFERHNLVHDAKHRQVVAEMSRRLRQTRTAVEESPVP